jgi:6-phosphogluconate dehydrogenase
MVGGEQDVVQRLNPVFATLAPGIGTAARTPGRDKTGGTAEQGYLHCGPSGAGHFVKMVHNGIEYGIMVAYAEGLNILHHANAGTKKVEVNAETTPLRQPELYQYELCLPDIAEVWRRGSVIASWLLDLTASELLTKGSEPEELRRTRVRFRRRTLDHQAAIDEAVPASVLSAALYERFSSRGDADFADKVLSAMRHEFGGHVEKAAPKQGSD